MCSSLTERNNAAGKAPEAAKIQTPPPEEEKSWHILIAVTTKKNDCTHSKS
jgi:hypothetical protein